MHSTEPPQNHLKATLRPKIYKADKSLQLRVGPISVTEAQIGNAERAIADAQEEFGPLAQMLLDKLSVAVEGASINPNAPGNKEALIQPVMQLKANAKMFGYDLITTLANVMLGFLESISQMDAASVEIVAAHYRTLKLIADRKMTGDGGPVGVKLQTELRMVCARYLAKVTQQPADLH